MPAVRIANRNRVDLAHDRRVLTVLEPVARLTADEDRPQRLVLTRHLEEVNTKKRLYGPLHAVHRHLRPKLLRGFPLNHQGERGPLAEWRAEAAPLPQPRRLAEQVGGAFSVD